VPREWRVCRFCYIYVEDPAHAMFAYAHAQPVPIRQVFLTKLYTKLPELDNTLDSANSLKFFPNILPRREITALLAKLAYDMLKIFEAKPMLYVQAPTPLA
ncbi:hypothetical protein B0H14DRAFT_2356149, partial [Mycena olivaceomarginata]